MADMLGADASRVDSGGWQNRRWQTASDSGGRRQTTAEGGGSTVEGGSGVDGSGWQQWNKIERVGGC